VSKSDKDPERVEQVHFNKERMLGKGGFGKVHAVVKKVGHDKGKWYAMKTLDKKILRKSNLLKEIKNEFELLKDCGNFLFTCNLFYCFQDDTAVYFVLDLALGGDMRYHLLKSKGRKFSESLTKFYIAQLILALEHMHSLNCLHRDIKPDNLLVQANGYIKLTDFGLGRKLLPNVSKGSCNEFGGTPGYMAPELYQKNHAHNNTAEWFSVGVLSHELLLSVRPYAEAVYKSVATTRVRRSTRTVRVESVAKSGKQDSTGSTKRVRVTESELLAMQPTVMTSDELKEALEGKEISKKAVSFLCKTLVKEPTKRLGWGTEKADPLKNHGWFEGFAWKQVMEQTFPVEYIPDTTEANVDCDDNELMDFLEHQSTRLTRSNSVINVDEFGALWFNYRDQEKSSSSSSRVNSPKT